MELVDQWSINSASLSKPSQLSQPLSLPLFGTFICLLLPLVSFRTSFVCSVPIKKDRVVIVDGTLIQTAYKY